MKEINYIDGEPSVGICCTCGEKKVLRMGCCFQCATNAEESVAKRTVFIHFCLSIWNCLRFKFTYARMDIRWAWQRLTRTGDYAEAGYFDQEGHKWR